MNHRDLALAAMRREPVDHIPFIGRMDLWYGYHHNRGTLPAPYENAELWDIQRDLGIGIFGFGVWDVSFFRLDYPGTRRYSDGNTLVTEYETPHGTLVCRDRMAEELSEAAGAGARIEYPFKTERDYDALQYLVDNTRVVENFDTYAKFVDSIGADGVALPFAGHLPAHQLMLHFMGYEGFYYQLFENESRVEAVINSLGSQYEQILRLAARCPAQAIEVGGNYDEQMTPPPVFDRHFAPLYRRAREVLSPAGKIMVIHGDGEMSVLLEKIMQCGVDVVEALTPAPMTSIDIRRTRELWDGRVAMWGGLPSVMLTSMFSEQEFETLLEDLFRAVAPGIGFILGFGDNVPTDALFPRVKRVAQFWAENGKCPA